MFAVAALMVSFPSPSIAAFKSGNQLVDDCTADPRSSTHFQSDAYCIGFVVGVVDDETMIGDILKRPIICLRPSVTAGQLRDVVIAYLQRHPEKRDYTAASLVMSAVLDAFPCPAK